MGVLYMLLFLQGITGQMVLHQPQNIVSVDVNGIAVITCVSTEDLDVRSKMSWYQRKWRNGEDPVRVTSCSTDNYPPRYACKHEKYVTSLEIYNLQITDSGVYYCVHQYASNFLKFGNGTILNVGDMSTIRSSIHILGHLQPHLSNRPLQLTCVVLGAGTTVYLYWNISGTYHKGRIISKEEYDGTWTVINYITLPKDNWNHEENVTCEVWLTSSPISVHWEIPRQDKLRQYVGISKCQSFLISVMTAGSLLVLMLPIHLIRTLRLTGDNNPDVMEKNNIIEDEITYSELNIHDRTRHKDQPAE